jgi:membrane protein YqaA with SNARE-associated domain
MDDPPTDRPARTGPQAASARADEASRNREKPEERETTAGWIRQLWHFSRRPAELAKRLNASRHRMWYLSVASFLETTVIPVAIELVLVPFMLANRNRIWTIATVTLAGCLAGAILGYLVGLLFFDTAGIWLIDTFGQREAYEAFQERFNRQGFWAIVAIGITPIPFPIAMLAAGAADYSFPLYVLACSIARGVRYYGLSALVALAGPRVLDWLQKGQRATKLTAAIAVAVVVGMLLFYF